MLLAYFFFGPQAEVPDDSPKTPAPHTSQESARVESATPKAPSSEPNPTATRTENVSEKSGRLEPWLSEFEACQELEQFWSLSESWSQKRDAALPSFLALIQESPFKLAQRERLQEVVLQALAIQLGEEKAANLLVDKLNLPTERYVESWIAAQASTQTLENFCKRTGHTLILLRVPVERLKTISLSAVGMGLEEESLRARPVSDPAKVGWVRYLAARGEAVAIGQIREVLESPEVEPATRSDAQLRDKLQPIFDALFDALPESDQSDLLKKLAQSPQNDIESWKIRRFLIVLRDSEEEQNSPLLESTTLELAQGSSKWKSEALSACISLFAREPVMRSAEIWKILQEEALLDIPRLSSLRIQSALADRSSVSRELKAFLAQKIKNRFVSRPEAKDLRKRPDAIKVLKECEPYSWFVQDESQKALAAALHCFLLSLSGEKRETMRTQIESFDWENWIQGQGDLAISYRRFREYVELILPFHPSRTAPLEGFLQQKAILEPATEKHLRDLLSQLSTNSPEVILQLQPSLLYLGDNHPSSAVRIEAFRLVLQNSTSLEAARTVLSQLQTLFSSDPRAIEASAEALGILAAKKRIPLDGFRVEALRLMSQASAAERETVLSALQFGFSMNPPQDAATVAFIESLDKELRETR